MRRQDIEIYGEPRYSLEIHWNASLGKVVDSINRLRSGDHLSPADKRELLALQSQYEMKRELGRELNHASRHTFALANLKNKARGVMTEIVAHKLECDSAKKSFDYKLYLAILAATKQRMANPANDALKTDYEYLMSLNKQGASSPERMIVGAMLIFVGALAMAAAIVGESVPLKAVGFVTMFFGVTMFCDARSYGATSATRDFSREVDHCNHRRAASVGEQRVRDEKSPLLVGMRR